MKLISSLGWAVWLLVGLPLMVISVFTALTLVFSILGIVTMFAAMAVPFAFAPPILQWLFRGRRTG